MNIDDYIYEHIEKEEFVTVQGALNYVLSNITNLDEKNLNQIIRRRLSELNAEKKIQRIRQGIYKTPKSFDIIKSGDLDKDLFIYLNKFYKDKWWYYDVSLEREMDINIQMSKKIKILLLGKISAREKEVFNKYDNLDYAYIVDPFAYSVKEYSITSLLNSKLFSLNDIQSIFDYLSKINIDIFDLLKVVTNINYFAKDGWKIRKTILIERENFKINFENLVKVKFSERK